MKLLKVTGVPALLVLLFLIPISREAAVGQSEGEESLNYAIELPGGGEGAASHIAIPPLNITALPVTIELWYKPDPEQNSYATLWYNRGASNNAGVQYDRWTDQSRIKAVWNGEAEIPAVKPVAGAWNHVALVVASSRKTLFINGTEFTESGSSFTNYPFDGVTFLGWDNALPDRTLKGLIDEVRFWDVEKTAQELEEKRFTPLQGDEPGLLGYWNFDDQAEEATDLTGNGAHGTVNGGEYVVSSVFEPMEYVISYAGQQDKVVDAKSADNLILTLNIVVENQNDPLELTRLVLSAEGTSHLQDMANVRLFASGSDSVFSTEMALAESAGSPEEQEFALDCSYVLSPGNNYFWITCSADANAAQGNVLELECLEAVLSGGGQQAHTPVKTLEGKLHIDPSQFVDFLKLPVNALTGEAATSIEGANFASFQQDVITTYKGYQYAAYWNQIANPCLARRRLPAGEWEIIEFADYRVDLSRVADNHYTISMGICGNDGTIHLAFDHHNDPLNYKKSVPGLANDPGEMAWSQASFSPTQDYLVNGSTVSNVTYPRFVYRPDGDLLFECRIGWSGDGDSFLWEYSGESGAWDYIGEYLNGTSVGENPYINGIHYDPNGSLHVSWVWRQTPDPLTNHDVYYGYSDDHGRTWRNAEGETVAEINTNPMTLNTPGLKVWTVGTQRGLINQESQAADSRGGIHILQSYMADEEPDNGNFWGSRIDHGYLRHIYQDESGAWQNDPIAPSGRNRSEVAADENDNLYVVAADGRIYFAAAANGWKNWIELDVSGRGDVMNEGLIDREALLQENVLSYIFAHGDNDGKIVVPSYLLEKKTPGTGEGLNITLFKDTEWLQPVEERLGEIAIDPGAMDLEGDISIRSAGIIETKYAEPYTLYLTVSGETRIWINDILKLETGTVEAPTEFEIAMAPGASHRHRIRIEGVYNSSSVVVKLEWSSDGQEREIVPAVSLYGELKGLPPVVNAIEKGEGRTIFGYPNPFESTFYIQAPGAFTYRIWDSLGRMRGHGTGKEQKLLGSELRSGIYFLEVTQKTWRSVFKIVKR